jgi:hypothetical protein
MWTQLAGTRRLLTEFPEHLAEGLAVDEFGAVLVVVPHWSPDSKRDAISSGFNTGAQKPPFMCSAR